MRFFGVILILSGAILLFGLAWPLFLALGVLAVVGLGLAALPVLLIFAVVMSILGLVVALVIGALKWLLPLLLITGGLVLLSGRRGRNHDRYV